MYIYLILQILIFKNCLTDKITVGGKSAENLCTQWSWAEKVMAIVSDWLQDDQENVLFDLHLF